jgi:hypothetical protein
MNPYEKKMALIRETAAELNPIPLRELAADLNRLAEVRETAEHMLARDDTLRAASLMGLQHQLHQITNHNHFDREDVITDLKRAINYMRNEK